MISNVGFHGFGWGNISEGNLKGDLHAYTPEQTDQIDNATQGTLVAERLCRIDLAQKCGCIGTAGVGLGE
jgi:outer membrane lipoprotein SlyB